LVVPIYAAAAKPPRAEPKGGRGSAVDSCVAVLRDAIVSGELPPGLRLPPERALAERFAVNRVTVRSALTRLEAEHLLTVRQGSGYSVRDYRRAGGPDLIATLASLARTAKDRAAIVRDLLAVRRQLARATLERLVENADDASLRDAGAAVDRFEAAVVAGAPVAELATRDLEVIEALVAATGSAVLQLCFNPVATLLRELPALQEAMYRAPQENVAAFRAVLELLDKRNLGGLELGLELLAARDEATVAAIASARGAGAGRTARPARAPEKKKKEKNA
jgi:GntR family transcriptional regulator, transcriptional repressor for pyruvate dehydrogenase complex